MNAWVVRVADGVFLHGGYYSPQFDPVTERLVILPDERMPDRERERYDANSATKRRPATAEELLANLTSNAQVTSRQKDVLATIAWVIRAQNVAAWNAMTVQQKATAVLNQADNWRDIRVFIDNNL